MSGNIEELIGNLVSKFEILEAKLTAKIESLEAKVTEQAQEITELKIAVGKLAVTKSPENSGAPTNGNVPESNSHKELAANQVKTSWETAKNKASDKTRRNFLKKLAATSLITFGAGLTAINTSQKEAQARILVNPTDYPIQFGAIATPPSTTISGLLQDTSVRIGLAACGDPTMSYANLPMFDTGIYTQGAGYGVYATSDKSAGVAGYFRNVAPAGVGQGLAITAISDNGTAISGTGSNTGFGISGICNGTGTGISGNSVSGVGVSGTTTNGVGLRGISDTGVPLRLTPSSSVPTGGTRVRGDIYLDMLGKVYVWARNDGNSADIWRQVQFVPA